MKKGEQYTKKYCDEIKKFAENLTKEQALEFLVSAGIYNKKGELMPPYNGDLKDWGFYRTN